MIADASWQGFFRRLYNQRQIVNSFLYHILAEVDLTMQGYPRAKESDRVSVKNCAKLTVQDPEILSILGTKYHTMEGRRKYIFGMTYIP